MRMMMVRLLILLFVSIAVGIAVAAMLYSTGESVFGPLTVRVGFMVAGISVLLASAGGLLSRIPAVTGLVQSNRSQEDTVEHLAELRNVLIF